MAIVKKKKNILGIDNWEVYSDENKYIMNNRTGVVYSYISTNINDYFTELDIEIETYEDDEEKLEE